MDKIISRLVEFDKKGQEIVQQAQEQRRGVLEHMSDFKQELSAQYRERSEARVEGYRQQAQADKEEQLAVVRARFDEQSANLRENYRKNSSQWVAQIVDRCLGR